MQTNSLVKRRSKPKIGSDDNQTFCTGSQIMFFLSIDNKGIGVEGHIRVGGAIPHPFREMQPFSIH